MTLAARFERGCEVKPNRNHGISIREHWRFFAVWKDADFLVALQYRCYCYPSANKKKTQFRVWKAGSASQVEFSSRSSRTENWPFLTNWPRGCGTPSDIDPILTRKRPSKAVVECATLSFTLSIKALRGMWRSDGTVHLWNKRTAHPTTFLLADFSEMRGRFLFFPFLANSNRRHSPWRGYYAIQCQTYYMQTFPWFSPF